MKKRTDRQQEAVDLMKVEGHPEVVARRMGIQVRAVQCLLRRAMAHYPVGRPISRQPGSRVSLVAASAA